jgi:methyl-accepting chemotaxis protein
MLVKDASAEISTGSQDLAQRTESQAASIEETAASMHEITTTGEAECG